MLNRRSFLKALGVVPVAVTAPAIAKSVDKNPPEHRLSNQADMLAVYEEGTWTPTVSINQQFEGLKVTGLPFCPRSGMVKCPTQGRIIGRYVRCGNIVQIY